MTCGRMLKLSQSLDEPQLFVQRELTNVSLDTF